MSNKDGFNLRERVKISLFYYRKMGAPSPLPLTSDKSSLGCEPFCTNPPKNRPRAPLPSFLPMTGRQPELNPSIPPSFLSDYPKGLRASQATSWNVFICLSRGNEKGRKGIGYPRLQRIYESTNLRTTKAAKECIGISGPCHFVVKKDIAGSPFSDRDVTKLEWEQAGPVNFEFSSKKRRRHHSQTALYQGREIVLA